MFEKRLDNITVGDIKLIKLSTFAFALFVAGFFSDFVLKWRWVWFVLFILFAIQPLMKFCKGKCRNPDKKRKTKKKK